MLFRSGISACVTLAGPALVKSFGCTAGPLRQAVAGSSAARPGPRASRMRHDQAEVTESVKVARNDSPARTIGAVPSVSALVAATIGSTHATPRWVAVGE